MRLRQMIDNLRVHTHTHTHTHTHIHTHTTLSHVHSLAHCGMYNIMCTQTYAGAPLPCFREESHSLSPWWPNKLRKPDSPPLDKSPVYQEISELSTRRASGHGEGSGSVDAPGLSSPFQLDSPPVSVYLNITRLSSETVVWEYVDFCHHALFSEVKSNTLSFIPSDCWMQRWHKPYISLFWCILTTVMYLAIRIQ